MNQKRKLRIVREIDVPPGVSEEEVAARKFLHGEAEPPEHWWRSLTVQENIDRWEDSGAESRECRICGMEQYLRGPGY